MAGLDLIRWTIWFATAFYFSRWICEFWPIKQIADCEPLIPGVPPQADTGRASGKEARATVNQRFPSRFWMARLFWTAACAFLWIHVGCAFHFYHHWSHAAAVEHNLEQTRAVVGFAFGGGVWINYATMVLWAGDVLWWWLQPDSFAPRPRWLSRVWNAFLAFIGINAAVVFATGPVRLGTLGGILLVTHLVLRRSKLQNEQCKAQNVK